MATSANNLSHQQTLTLYKLYLKLVASNSWCGQSHNPLLLIDKRRTCIRMVGSVNADIDQSFTPTIEMIILAVSQTTFDDSNWQRASMHIA